MTLHPKGRLLWGKTGKFMYFHFQPNFNQTLNKAFLVKGIQVCSNEGSCPFLMGIKTHGGNLKKHFFSGQFQPNLAQIILG